MPCFRKKQNKFFFRKNKSLNKTTHRVRPSLWTNPCIIKSKRHKSASTKLISVFLRVQSIIVFLYIFIAFVSKPYLGFVFHVTATEVAVTGTRLDLNWDVVLWLEHQNDCVLYYFYCVSQINVNI